MIPAEMTFNIFVFTTFMAMRSVFISCPIVLQRDAVQTYRDVRSQALPAGKKTWFKYVQKALETSTNRCQEMNCKKLVFIKHHLRVISNVIDVFVKIKKPEKENPKTLNPTLHLLCKEVYQVVKEDRSNDKCYQVGMSQKMDDMDFLCQYVFSFHLSPQLRLNITFSKLRMSVEDCILTKITIHQSLMPNTDQVFCGTYTPFTIYTKSTDVFITYRYEIEANYQSVFTFSVMDLGEVVSFPSKMETFWFENQNYLTTAEQHISVSLIKPSAAPTPHTTPLYVFYFQIEKYLGMVVSTKVCEKGTCFHTRSPFSQELRQTRIVSTTKYVLVAGFQYILLYIPNVSFPNTSHLDNKNMTIAFLASYFKFMQDKVKNITLQPGKKNIEILKGNVPSPRVQIWDIFCCIEDGKYTEVHIQKMFYKENLHSTKCLHGGFSSYDFNNRLGFVLIQTICSDYMKYVGNKRLYSAGQVLRLVFYQYLHNLIWDTGGPYSNVAVELAISAQPCYPVSLDVCTFRVTRAQQYVIKEEYLKRQQLEWYKAGLEGSLSPDGELILSVHSKSKCVVLQVYAITRFVSRLVRCYVLLRPKAIISGTGTGVGFLMEGCYSSTSFEFKVHHNPNVFYQTTSDFFTANENSGLRILPWCSHKFLTNSDCGVSDIFEKNKLFAFVESPFHQKDLTVEFFFLPFGNSWASFKIYRDWVPDSQKFPREDFFINTSKPIEDLKLPFSQILRVWHLKNGTRTDFVSHNVLLLLESETKHDKEISLLLKLKVWREWNERGKCEILATVLWNKPEKMALSHAVSGHVATNTRRRLFLSLQGDIPQYLSHENKIQSMDQSLDMHIIWNFIGNIRTNFTRNSNITGHYSTLAFKLPPVNSQIKEKTVVFVEKQIHDDCSEPLQSWEDAQQVCRNMNAMLPTLRSRKEQDILVALIKLSKELLFIESVFVGIHKSGHDQVHHLLSSFCTNQMR